ncbi:DMT family transporter [bacterium AH-315-C20]|nr:DMT family transporter [bacterium AH-315-C20]
MLLSSLSFALANICVKILTDNPPIFPEIQDYPVHELVLFRSVVSLSICVAIIKAKKLPFFGNNKKWLLTRGIAGVTSLTLFFFTLQNLPMAIATIVQYLSPIFTILFAMYLINEKVRPVQWLFFLISFVGIIVMGIGSNNSGGGIEMIWLLTGIGSAIVSGIAYNAIMKCSNTDEPITVVMYFPLVATPLMIVACFVWGFIMPQGIEWLILILIGILTQIAQISMTKAFNSAPASRITPIKYVGAIYAVAIGFFVFDETLGLYSSLGVILILIGVLLNTFIKQVRTSPKGLDGSNA